MTYTYWVDYLCSFNMAVILNELNGADRMESICFYSDPELLFSAFGCETEEERAELVNALISVNVLQTSPESFYKRYEEEYGERPDADEEKHEAFRYSLKPAVATTLMKTYYKNLVSLLERQELNINDLCFLINVFESQMNQHLSYDRDKAEEVNMPFYESCLALRGQLFDALESSNEGLDMESVWQEYDMSKMGEKTLNAALDFLPDDKKMFFLERCQWHADRVDLGVKLPNIAK